MQYSHRNGETERPTIDGIYYLIGTLGWWDIRSPNEGLVEVYAGNVYTFGTEKYWRLRETTGRWWGPLEPPEGEDNE